MIRRILSGEFGDRGGDLGGDDGGDELNVLQRKFQKLLSYLEELSKLSRNLVVERSTCVDALKSRLLLLVVKFSRKGSQSSPRFCDNGG